MENPKYRTRNRSSLLMHSADAAQGLALQASPPLHITVLQVHL